VEERRNGRFNAEFGVGGGLKNVGLRRSTRNAIMEKAEHGKGVLTAKSQRFTLILRHMVTSPTTRSLEKRVKPGQAQPEKI